MNRIERRNVLAHVIEYTILTALGVVVLVHFFVTTVVLHIVGVGQVHQAIAMAQTVVRVGFEEVHGLGKGTVQQKIIVGGEDHIRRGDLLDAVHQFGLDSPVSKLRQMPVVDGVRDRSRALQRNGR